MGKKKTINELLKVMLMLLAAEGELLCLSVSGDWRLDLSGLGCAVVS